MSELTFVLKEAHIDFILGFALMYYMVSWIFISQLNKHISKHITSSLSHLFDYVFIGSILLYSIYSFSKYTVSQLFDLVVEYSLSFYVIPLMTLSTLLFIIVFSAVTFALGIHVNGKNTPWSVTIITKKGWYLLYTQVIYHVFGIIYPFLSCFQVEGDL